MDLFLSPHLDDAALSCGGRIAMNASRGIPQQVVTLFAGLPQGSADDIDFVKLRRAEDVAALTCLGLEGRFAQLDLVDALYRTHPDGRRLYGHRELSGAPSPIDLPLVDAIVEAVTPWLGDADVTVFAPLVVGHHVDHQLTHEAACRLAARGHRVRFYEDVPYSVYGSMLADALEPKIGWTGEELELEDRFFERKLEALEHYASQMWVLFTDAAEARARLRTEPLDEEGEPADPSARRPFVERVWYPG